MPAVKEQTQEVTDTSVIVFCLIGLFFWRSLQVMLSPLGSKEQLFCRGVCIYTDSILVDLGI